MNKINYKDGKIRDGLKISFVMPLIDYGIKSKDKSKGYGLVDGHTDTAIVFEPPKGGRNGINTHLPDYSTVTKL